MIRSDALNLHVYLVRTEMTVTKQILISHVCSADDIILKEFLVGKTLSQICFTDKDESKVFISDKSSREEDELDCVHKNIF